MQPNVHRTSRPPEGFPPQLRLAHISGLPYLLIRRARHARAVPPFR